MDWLLARQDAIEKKLAARHLGGLLVIGALGGSLVHGYYRLITHHKET